MTRLMLLAMLGTALAAVVQNQRGKKPIEDRFLQIPTSLGATPLKQKSLSLGLFKNGYAFYAQTFQVSTDGTYLIDIPETSHGSLSVTAQRNVSVVTQTNTREVQEPVDFTSLTRENMQTVLAGQTVSFKINNEQFQGKIVSPVKCTDDSPPSCKSSPSSDFLAIEDASGNIALVKPSDVQSLKIQKPSLFQTTRKETATTIAVTGTNGNPTDILITYLVFGLTWAPSYQIDLGEQDLRIDFQATIRNEGPAIEAQDVSLITGYPNLEFLTAPSLFSGDIKDFISGATRSAYSRERSNPGIATQAILSNAYGVEPSFETTKVAAEGSDISHIQIGPLSLASKTAILRNIDTAYANFRRVVDWDASEDEAWDAIRFENPFPTAITTAPVTVTEDRALTGQSSTTWTPARGTAVVKVSKALSVRVRHSMVDGKQTTESRQIATVPVSGTLIMTNLRASPITACIQYDFNGALDKNPFKANSTLSEGTDSLNPHTNVNWEIPVGGSSRINITFSYIRRVKCYGKCEDE